MRLRQALLAIAILSAPPAIGSPVQASPVASEDLAVKKDLCDRIAAAMTPKAVTLGRVDRGLDLTFAALLKQDPTLAEMESAYPGLMEAVKQAWRPIIIEQATQILPLRRAEISQLHLDNLTIPEARELLTVMKGRAFQALLVASASTATFQASAQNTAGQQDASASDSQAWLRLTPGQRIQIGVFMESALGRKWDNFSPDLLAIDAKWANHLPPTVERELELAMHEAMLDHIAKNDPEAAASFREYLEKKGALPKS